MPETVLGSPVSFDGLESASACASSAAQELADAVSSMPLIFDWRAGRNDSPALVVNPNLVYAGSTGDAGPLYWSNDYTRDVTQEEFDDVMEGL